MTKEEKKIIKKNKKENEKKEYLFNIEKINEYKEKIEKLEGRNKELEESFKLEFSKELEPENLQLNEEFIFTKTITNKTDTEKYVEEIKNTMFENFKQKGNSIVNESIIDAQTIKTTFNKTKFNKSLKDRSKKEMLDIKELIAAAEDKSSEKTIKFKLEKIGDRK